jgi:adenosine kinase
MLAHAEQFVAAGIPFIFDPGQALPLFNGPELIRFVEQADWIAANDYEWALIQERTGLSSQQVTERVKALIVTQGAEGSTIFCGAQQIPIPPAPISQVVDPTGCGDAYRAGLLYGLMHQMDWETTGRIASLAGAIKIETAGTQNHSFTPDVFQGRFFDSFNYRF